MSQELLIKNELAEFEEFRSQLSELKEGNSKAVFDYRDKDGNKLARSHIAKLRKTKTAIADAHKKAKAFYLEKGRAIDRAKNELTADVEEMISVHLLPLQAIEDEEKARISRHTSFIEYIDSFRDTPSNISSHEANELIIRLNVPVIDESLEEFMAEASIAKKKAAEFLQSIFDNAKAREAEQEELERLRAEAAKRDQELREMQIAAEAKREAEADAKDAAERREREIKEAEEASKAEALRREEEHKAELERVEQQRINAINQAEAERVVAIEREKAAVERARKDAEAKAEYERLVLAEQAETERRNELARSQNLELRRSVNNEVLESLVSHGIGVASAKKLIAAIARDEIRHVTINY